MGHATEGAQSEKNILKYPAPCRTKQILTMTKWHIKTTADVVHALIYLFIVASRSVPSLQLFPKIYLLTLIFIYT